MPQFSKKSQERLATCHPDLQAVCNAAIKEIDFAVICGHRGEADQNKAFAEGNSKVKYPNSRHNSMPSEAVDLAPVTYVNGKAIIDWNDIEAFRRLAMAMLHKAGDLGIPLEWGGGWTTFKDYPHFQLKNKGA